MNFKNLMKNVDYKALALQYCDKAAVAVVSCLLLWFLLLGVQKARSTAKISPDDITTLASNLRTKVDNSKFDAVHEKIVNPDYTDVARGLTTKIDMAEYKWSQPFMKFLDFGAILRQQPEILSPYSPRVHADRGAVSMAKTDANGDIMWREPAAAPVKKPEDKKPKKKEPPKPAPKQASSKPPAKGAQAKAPAGKGGGQQGGGQQGGGGMGMRMSGGMGGKKGGGMMGSGGGMMGSGGGMMGSGGGEMGMGMGSMGGDEPGSMSGALGSSGVNKRGQQSTAGDLRSSQVARSAPNKRKPSNPESRMIGDTEDEENGTSEPGQASKGPAKPRRVPEEIVRGLRWVVVTYLLPHIEQVKKFHEALHADEDPQYMQVRVERRELESDQTFSEWAEVDWNKMDKEVIRLLPAKVTGDPKRWDPENDAGHQQIVKVGANFPGLVMSLPDLAIGDWAGVDRFEAYEAAKKAASNVAPSDGGDGASNAGAGGEEGIGEEQRQRRSRDNIFGGGGPPGVGGPGGSGPMSSGAQRSSAPGGMSNMNAGTSEDAGMMKGGMKSRSAQGTSAGATAGEAAKGVGGAGRQRIQRTSAELVQIRFLDYTVEPEHTYQYRLKVVVKNPNEGREDVADDAIAKLETLESQDWSEPTPPVLVPPDKEYYLVDHNPKKRDEAKLEVHRWEQPFGDWAFVSFATKPGDTIGSERETELVDVEDNKKKTKVDFATQDLLLDVTGGDRTFSVDGSIYTENMPAEVFVVDNLGELNSQSEDFGKNNRERKAREKEYNDALERAKGKSKDATKDKGKPEQGKPEDFRGDDDRMPRRRGSGGID